MKARGAKPFGGYPSKTAYAFARKSEGATYVEIGAEMKMSPARVRNLLIKRAVAGANAEINEALRPHAARRRVPLFRIKQQVLLSVVEYGLVDRMLADTEPEKKPC